MNKQKAIEMAKELGPEYRYVAMDNSGWWYAFKKKPKLKNGDWYDIDLSHTILFNINDEYENTLTKVYDYE